MLSNVKGRAKRAAGLPASLFAPAGVPQRNPASSPSDIEESTMKIVMLAALIGLAASSTAFAQTNTGPNDPHPGSGDSSFTTASTTDQAGQWVAPYGQPVAGRTRAQVYQRLVNAEQDGQLSYLDKTLYAHH
jgi:hypothetical protein